MILSDLSKPLTADQIDFRVQSINRGGYATILAYKDARVDMQRLDDVCGPLNWRREHSRDNHNCIVSVWDGDKCQWVSKEDTGTESFTEAQKGLASDSFKRACFNWGIGRELYDYPLISVELKGEEWELKDNRGKQTYKLRLREWRWSSYFEDGMIRYLAAKDQNGSERFCWYSLEGLSEIINLIAAAISSGDDSEVANRWAGLSEGEKAAMWVAKSKGGPFSQQEKEFIRNAR